MGAAHLARAGIRWWDRSGERWGAERTQPVPLRPAADADSGSASEADPASGSDSPAPAAEADADSHAAGLEAPPPFTMEYLGTFGPTGRRVAVFRKKIEGGAEIKVGLEGGVFEDDFIIRTIDLESVVIGYVGFPEKEMKRVPLAED